MPPLNSIVSGIFMSEKNIIKTARFHRITAGIRFAEFILRETEGLTQIPPLAELRIPQKRSLAFCGDMKLTRPETYEIVNDN